MMGFQQAQYKYICSRADKGVQYDYADEDKSTETKDYWLLMDYKNRLLATVIKNTGEVYEGMWKGAILNEGETL